MIIKRHNPYSLLPLVFHSPWRVGRPWPLETPHTTSDHHDKPPHYYPLLTPLVLRPVVPERHAAKMHLRCTPVSWHHRKCFSTDPCRVHRARLDSDPRGSQRVCRNDQLFLRSDSSQRYHAAHRYRMQATGPASGRPIYHGAHAPEICPGDRSAQSC